MESLVHADIFFLVTTMAVIICTAFFVVIGVYIVKIVRNFSHISETLKKGVDTAGEELGEMSEHVRESPIFTFMFGKKKKKKRSTKKS